MVSRHGARSPARRAPCRRRRTTWPSRSATRRPSRKTTLIQVRNDEGAEIAYTLMSCEKIVRRTFRITSRCTQSQTRPLDQLSKNHSRPNALASTLFLLFGTRCRSDARGHGLFEARLPRARPLEVRRAVGLDRSFVRQLWRPLSAGATRPAANIIICHLVSSLSRGCPSTRTIHPPRTCIEPTLQ